MPQPQERVALAQEFCVGVAARFCAILSGEIVIGWGAEQGGSLGKYNATYTPYLKANFGMNFTLSSLPLMGGYGIYVHAARLQLPILLDIDTTAMCAQGSLSLLPVEA